MLHPNKQVIVRYVGFMIIISILPMLLIGLISYQLSSNALQESEERYARTVLLNQKALLEQQLEQIENLVANISGVEDITAALDDAEVATDSYIQLATQARIGYILNGYLNLKGLVSIDIFTIGGAHYHVGDTLDIEGLRRDIKDRVWQETVAAERQVYWAGVIPNVNSASQYEEVLSAAKVLKVLDRKTMTQRPIAMIMVNFSLDQLALQFEQTQLLPGSQLALLDQHNGIIYSNSKGVEQDQVLISLHGHIHNYQGVKLTDDYLLQELPLENYDWHLVSATPISVLLENALVIRNVTTALIIIGLLVVLVSGWAFIRNILSPIRSVIGAFKSLQHDSFDLTSRLPVKGSDEVAELLRWFNSFLDNIQARRESEAALRVSEKRYELVVNASHEALWDWNLKDNTLYLAPRFLSLIGMDPMRESLSSNRPDEWLDRVHRDDIEPLQQAIQAHLKGDTGQLEFEYRLQRQDGSYRWILCHGLVEYDTSNTPVRMAGSHTDISDRKEAESRLRHDAFHDPLTGLSNRAWFTSYLAKKITGLRRDTNGFAVLFLDLDHFKMVNDTLGHAVGDKLLIEVSQRLQQMLRNTDLLARLGGDEFVILLEHSDDYHYVKIAERVLEEMAQPFYLDGQEINSGVSIGISLSLHGYTEPDEMIRDADIAMYQSKLSGKNRYTLFDANMREHLLSQLTLERELRTALSENQLELHYQPIVNLWSGALVGCEALIRWRHPVKGLLQPDQFIPVAESSNLIQPIGWWILDTVCKQWRQWTEQYPEYNKLRISINLSAVQLHDEQLLERMGEILRSYQMPSGSLAIEITETALIRDNKLAANIISNIKNMGISVHLDDFGTGYSSLSHLTDFPIDVIKIDRSFINSSGDDDPHRRMVKGLLSMASDLGLKCIAEGIETESDYRFLYLNHCEYGQGYYMARPLTTEKMEELLASHKCLLIDSVVEADQ